MFCAVGIQPRTNLKPPQPPPPPPSPPPPWPGTIICCIEMAPTVTPGRKLILPMFQVHNSKPRSQIQTQVRHIVEMLYTFVLVTSREQFLCPPPKFCAWWYIIPYHPTQLSHLQRRSMRLHRRPGHPRSRYIKVGCTDSSFQSPDTTSSPNDLN
jgi:hypothetical protein